VPALSESWLVELRFKIKDLPSVGAPFRAQRPVPQALLAEVLDGASEDPARSHAEIEVELIRDHDEVIGRGRVKGALELSCSRCLDPARLSIDTRIDLLFHREGQLPEKGDDDDTLAGADTFTHDGTYVSLEEPLRELLIAELPISILCKADCRGLCSTCGANQNTPEGRACGHPHSGPIDTDTSGKGLKALADIKLQS
jgi:uncharacterized protein